MGSRRARSWSGVLVVAAVAATACDAEEPDTGALSTADYPAPALDLGRAGDPLADGLVVGQGSALLGPLLVNDVHEGDAPAAWTAYLVVDGDPLGVWDAYVEQVGSLGLLVAGEDQPGVGCAAYSTGVSCYNWLNLDGAEFDRWVDMRLERLPDDREDRYLLTIATAGLGGGAPVPGRWLVDHFDEHPRGLEPRVPTPNPAPIVGGRLGEGTTVPTEEFLLVEGSRLVAQVGPGGATGGLEVLLALQPGATPAQVSSRYEAQCERAIGGSAERTQVAYGDATQMRVTRLNPGIGTCTVSLVDGDGGIDYIVLRRFND